MKGNTSKKKNDRWKIVIGAVISITIMIAIVLTVIEKKEVANEQATKPDIEEQSKPTIDGEEQNNSSQNEESNEQQPEQDENNVEEEPTEQKPSVEIDSGGYPVTHVEPTEPMYVDGVMIVNKKHPLPKTFNKGEDATARAAFEKMAASAKNEGFELVAFSGYRSYDYQVTLYTNYLNRDGKAAADRYSARPGYSEHQTGLTFDIGEKGREDLWLTSEFGETPAGQWLMKNAHNYGFIQRYPKGKEDITGYMYESWHYRYVGVELATAIYQANTTLEEYLNIQ
ncbi:D-alanyl-D-alanine carboxypeptidase family protein [Solibacillus sp. CAU 1738]|uniref:M15 family metallopeptidase n=1 Tax=Solibacillus sp. CAU 1738 TaxID=3140363 RepID=UPI0032605D52